MIGRQFGQYTITGELGRGGMGEVYRARDARLEREVALKFLAAASPEALERHRREARLLAALSHPNIATIHGLEEHADQPFLVLELVEGRSLEQELAHGPLPLDRAIAIGHQVAEALAASHARGILHRDLKPGNIHVRPDGLVKVLDFGLGKLQQPADDDGTTLEVGLTRAGAVQGTPEYMSPEQLRGERVDVAADLWGLGCVLYQLLTGQRPFRADQPLALYAAILERPVDLSALPAATPPPLRELVARCLEKRAANRLRDAAEAAARLSTLEGRAPAPAAVPRLVQLSHSDALEESPAWAPDGQQLAYSRLVGAVRKIFVQPADGGPARQLTHGEHDDLQPAFTPDGKALLFVRAQVAGTKLEPGDAFGGYDNGDVWRLDLASGEERLLVRDAFNPCPHPTNGSIAVDAAWAGSCRLWVVDDRGRNPRQLSSDSSEATWHLRPRWSPDGRFLVFQYVERTVYELRVLDPATGAMHATHDDLIADLQPCFSHDGRHIHFTSAYRSGGLNLWRVPVDDQARATGPLEQVTTGAGQDINVAIGPQGQLAYTTIRQNADLWRLPVDPATGAATGAPEKVLGSSREDSRGAWSPDGQRVAFNSDRMGSMHLWLLELEDGSLRQLTRGVGGDYQPRWSPDATRLVFFSSRQGNPGIWVLDLAEGSEPRCLSPDGQIEVNPLFSPDGEHIYYQSDRDGRMELWRMRSDGRDPEQLTRMGVGGHFLALDGSGRRVIFKQIDGPVMWMPLEGGEAEPLPTVRGGHHLSVAPDGGHIMDVEGHKQLWVSPLPAGEPRKVFRFEHPDDRIDYPLWSPDGKWILLDRFRPEGGDIWVREAPG